MRLNSRYPAIITLAATLCLGAFAVADEYTLDWFTTAGGGATFSTGGDFSLGATAGQPGTETLAGGDFTLTGGFWAGVPLPCSCPANLDGDARPDGTDIQAFVKCLTTPGGNCDCADVNLDFQVNLNDVQPFVNLLLTGHACQ